MRPKSKPGDITSYMRKENYRTFFAGPALRFYIDKNCEGFTLARKDINNNGETIFYGILATVDARILRKYFLEKNSSADGKPTFSYLNSCISPAVSSQARRPPPRLAPLASKYHRGTALPEELGNSFRQTS